MWIRIVAVIGLLAGVYLVGNGAVSLWDRDELRYAQASKQLLESGDWIKPYFLDEPRLKKPIFIYWCQAAAMKVFGPTDWSARFPSVVATVLTLGLLAATIGRGISTRAGLWTIFIYGTAGLTIAAAKMSITDAVLVLFILSAQVCFYQLFIGKRGWGLWVGLGVAVGLAGLTKGPVVLGVLATTALALVGLRLAIGRDPDSPPRPAGGNAGRVVLGGLLAVGVAALVIGPWLYAMEQRVPNYTLDTLRGEVLNRAAKPQEGHSGPPGFYLLAVWETFFPWSLLVPAAAVEAWKHRREPDVQFAIAAIVGPWIMFELVATKLPHYILPTYAPLAYLVARMLIRSIDLHTQELHQKHWWVITSAWAMIVTVLGMVPLAAIIAWDVPINAFGNYIAVLAFAAFTAFYAWNVHTLFMLRHPAAAALWMGGGMMLLVSILYTLWFPRAAYLRLSENMASFIPPGVPAGQIMMIDYKEPSLAFYQGGTIRPQEHDDFLQQTPPAGWPRYMVVTDTVRNKTTPEIQRQVMVVNRVRGWAYADGGRLLELLLLEKK